VFRKRVKQKLWERFGCFEGWCGRWSYRVDEMALKMAVSFWTLEKTDSEAL
jgi:hypothetical protein